jgi:hypothetical protein
MDRHIAGGLANMFAWEVHGIHSLRPCAGMISAIAQTQHSCHQMTSSG